MQLKPPFLDPTHTWERHLVKISKIAVNGLFDRFNHDLTFNPSERIAIMYGPNGFGKTMILRILNVLFNLSPRSLARMPFQELQIIFDDDSSLIVDRPLDESSLQLSYSTSGNVIEKFTPGPHIRPQELPFPLGAIEDIVPDIEQIAASEWRNIHSGDILDLDEVFMTYGEQLSFHLDMPEHSSSIPPWLREIRTSLPVRFIGTERLTDLSSYALRNRHRRPYSQTAPERTVRRYSDRLAQMVQETLTTYATMSQSLDRTFPARLVKEATARALPAEELAQVLEQVEKRRSEIVEAGLLLQEHETLNVPPIDTIDEPRRSVLTVYARDARQKLGVFDDLYARVNTFVRIINARLLYKRVSVGQEGLKIWNSDGSNLQPEVLSSGEQHEIVILFDLLFTTVKDSLILVDEPELSLHVDWQRAMLKDLQEMAELSDFRALLATHSPQIIGDRWDLTIELRGPNTK